MAQYPYDPTQPPPGQYYPGPPPPTNTMAILAIVFAFLFSPLGIIGIAFVVLAFIIFLGTASTVVGY